MRKHKYRHTDTPSLLQGDVPDGEEVCFITGLETHCEFHHVMGGNKIMRKRSEAIGAWVWLSVEEHHNLHSTPEGAALEKKLKELCQIEFEKKHSRKEWMGLFHKNYTEGS